MNRERVLLRAAYDLLKTADADHYVRSPLEITVWYDKAECDGSCLMDDIRHELGLPEHEPPIPIQERTS
jgi:hypothetical protein